MSLVNLGLRLMLSTLTNSAGVDKADSTSASSSPVQVRSQTNDTPAATKNETFDNDDDD